MRLPVNPPILPMLSKRANEIPQGQEWIFEPKWDGFRALVFRDREEILIQSRDGKSLNRYFPELLEPLLTQLSDRCVLDGEIVVAKSGRLDFEALQLRIHPASSRVKLLSEKARHRSCSSTCFAKANGICVASRSKKDDKSWSPYFHPRLRRSISRQQLTTRAMRRTGLGDSRAQGSTVSWPSQFQVYMSPTSA